MQNAKFLTGKISEVFTSGRSILVGGVEDGFTIARISAEIYQGFPCWILWEQISENAFQVRKAITVSQKPFDFVRFAPLTEEEIADALAETDARDDQQTGTV